MTNRARWEEMTRPKMSSFERSKRDIADNVRKAKEAKPAPTKPSGVVEKGNIMKVEKALKDAGVY
jgi:hypothetical protein